MKLHVPHCLLLAVIAAFLAPAHLAYSQGLSLGSAANFALLGLENGNVIINSATKIVGNAGYSSGVVSPINQKAMDFTGDAFVHSGASFSYTDRNFLPSGGIQTGSGVDGLMNQANADLLILATSLNNLAATSNIGQLGDDDSRILVSTGSLNVIDIAGLNYNSDSLTLQSRSGLTDTFILRVAGNFNLSQSSVILNGLSAANVLFYFPNESSIMINKAATVFNGTILAPTGSVEYHNPAAFHGAILAQNISVHSDFNLTQVTFVPEPSAALLVVLGAALLVGRRRR